MAQMRCYANEQILKGIASEKEDIDNLKTDVTGIKADITTINTDIDTIEGRLDGIDSTLTTMQDDIDDVETSVNTVITQLNNYVSFYRFKAVGRGGTDVPSLTIEANGVALLDVTAMVQIPTGYRMIGDSVMFVESLSNTNIVPIYFQMYNDVRSLTLKNLTATAQTINNLWVGVPIVKDNLA